MTYNQVLKHYKSVPEITARFGWTRQRIHNWKKRGGLPLTAQYQISEDTAGKLKVSK